MDGKSHRVRLPSGVNTVGIMKASIILVSCCDIAMDQLNYLEGTGARFYRHSLKQGLKGAKKVLDPYLNEFLNWSDMREEDDDAEKGYYQVTSMIELFCKILAETPGKDFAKLSELLNAFKNGDYRTVSEEVISRIEKESIDRDTGNDSRDSG